LSRAPGAGAGNARRREPLAAALRGPSGKPRGSFPKAGAFSDIGTEWHGKHACFGSGQFDREFASGGAEGDEGVGVQHDGSRSIAGRPGRGCVDHGGLGRDGFQASAGLEVQANHSPPRTCFIRPAKSSKRYGFWMNPARPASPKRAVTSCSS